MIATNRLGWALGVTTLVLGVAGCLQETDGVASVRGPLAPGQGDPAAESEPGEPSSLPALLPCEGSGCNANVQLLAESTCDRAKPYAAPTLVSGFDTRDVFSARLSADETSAVLALADGSNVELYAASRTTSADPFVIGDPLATVNTAADEYWPSLSADHRMMFFESGRNLVVPDGGTITNQQSRIWVATRTTAEGAFGAPTVLGLFKVARPEGAPYLHPGGRALYFTSWARGGAGDADIFVADITEFGIITAFRNITSANGPGEENTPIVSDDERALFYSRYGSGTGRDIWVVGRATTEVGFGLAQEVVELTSPYDDFPSSISPDGCRLYFISNRPVGGVSRYRVWLAEKPM
jgi:hypothetical protein